MAYYISNYSNKTLPDFWYSNRIPDMYKPDPDDFPNQDTGLYHNYDSCYNDNFSPEYDSWREDYMNTYGEMENYTVITYFSDDDLSD